MSPTRLSTRQRRIIESLDRHLLISAGAGSGKTFTVVRALLYRLGVPVDDLVDAAPLSLDAIAAITFTTAAAADLVRGLRGALREANRLELAEQVDVARIGTIHAFCGSLLRSFGLRGDRRLAGRVVEEAEARELLATAVRDVLRDTLSRANTGLEAVLARHTLRDVESHVAVLATDGGRLHDLLGSDTERSADAAALLRIAAEARHRMDALLAEVPGVDFDRLLVWTRDLLRDDRVLRAVRQRLRLLVVDEFQDVDPVQRDIVLSLGAPGTNDPSATRLLVVGDPKQSIYRFRRADVTVWDNVSRIFAAHPAEAAILPLDESYRSLPGILAFVDHTVGQTMTQSVTTSSLPFHVPYAPLTAVRPAQNMPGPAVEVVALCNLPNAQRTSDARAVDADVVAARLAALHGLPMANDAGAPLQWADMAILVSAWNAADAYADACTRHGVPVYVVRGDGFLETQEVKDGLLFLRYLRDARDAVARIGVWRGPAVALRDESVIALTWPDGEEPPPIAADDAARVADAEALLRDLRVQRDRVPAHRLLRRWLDATGYRASLALRGDADAVQALANLSAFEAFVEREAGDGIGALLRRVAEMRGREQSLEQARVYGHRENVVTITSIHGAKGLDWPVVAWVDLLRGLNTTVLPLLIGRDAVEVKEPGVETAGQPASFLALADAIGQEARAERLRLRYVAATRAKSRLLVSGVQLPKPASAAPAGGKSKAKSSAPDAPAPEAKSDAEWLVRALSLHAESTSGEIAVRAHDGSQHLVALTVVDVTEHLTTLPEAAAPSFDTPLLRSADDVPVQPPPVEARWGRLRHSATALMEHQRCPRRYAWRYLLGFTEPEGAPAPAGTDAPQRVSPQLVGNISHEALARLDATRDVTRAINEVMAEREEEDDPLTDDDTDDDADALRAAVRAAVDATLTTSYGDALANPAHRRELAFLRVLPDGSALEGAVDLVEPTTDGLVITDVKTSSVAPGDEAQVAARYALQRDVYAEALGAIADRRVAKVQFVFPATGREVDAWDDNARNGLTERMATHVAALERTAPDTATLASNPATCRRCGFGAAGWCPGAT
jgi:ATP-dependent helicase/nuclease subunit A